MKLKVDYQYNEEKHLMDKVDVSPSDDGQFEIDEDTVMVRIEFVDGEITSVEPIEPKKFSFTYPPEHRSDGSYIQIMETPLQSSTFTDNI